MLLLIITYIQLSAHESFSILDVARRALAPRPLAPSSNSQDLSKQPVSGLIVNLLVCK